MKDAINITIQDAIQEIDGLVHAAMREYNIKDEEDAYDEEVLGMAVWAMNKQVPMKPVRKGKNLYCPNCDQWLLWDDATPNEGDNYCGICGQKIDWED